MAALASLNPLHARSTGLASTSGRHAAAWAALQPPTTSRAAGSSRRRLPPRCATVDNSQPAAASARPLGLSPGALASRPAAVSPAQLQQLQHVARQQQQRQQLQQQQAAQQQAAAQAAPEEPELVSREGQLTDEEVARRKKISQANKGKTPWNKGRRHPPETIAKIKAATKKAMQRPDVKQRLAKANENREPHSNEAKEKIREKLLQRARVAREEINSQADLIIERLKASDDPALVHCAGFSRAQQVVAGLIWQFFKKDWDQVATVGWEENEDFRKRVVDKLTMLVNRRAEGQRKKLQSRNKMKQALDTLNKVQAAREKLAEAEATMAKLQRAKAAFANDPSRLRQALVAEEKGQEVLNKLRQQVAQLEAALQPLQSYLDDAEGAQEAAEEQEQQDLELEQQLQRQLELERKLEEAQQQQQQGGGGSAAVAAAPGQDSPADSAVDGPAAGLATGAQHMNGIASANGAASGWAADSPGSEQPGPQAALNGHAASAPEAGAVPVRGRLPRQQQ